MRLGFVRRAAVLFKPPIWVFTAFHSGLLFGHMYRDWKLEPLWIEESNATAVATALLVFFSVFYGGNAYSRYFNFYTACMGVYSSI